MLGRALEVMRAEAVTELADPKLRQPCRKVLESLQEHWTGLVRFVDDPRIPLDNNASERAGRGPARTRAYDLARAQRADVMLRPASGYLA